MSSQQYLSGDLFSYTNGAYEFSVFRVLFAYFDESMSSIGGYEP